MINLRVGFDITGQQTIQELDVAFLGTLSVQDIANSLGFGDTLPVDLLSISNPAVNYSAVPFRLALDATISIPLLSFNNQALLIVEEKGSFSVSVRCLQLRQSRFCNHLKVAHMCHTHTL